MNLHGTSTGTPPMIPTASPKSCVGQTPPGHTNWQLYSSSGLYLDVDTRSCAAGATPQYITALGGSANHWQTSGATSVYQPTATGFRVYVNYRNGTITPAQANSWQWHINWRIASEKVVTKYYYFNGQRHPRGSRMKQNGG